MVRSKLSRNAPLCGVAAALLLSSACTLPPAEAEVFPLPINAAFPAQAAVSAPSTARTEHVVVISIDGLRPDAIDAFGATTLQRLMKEGSYSLEAQTIPLSKTLPSHTSMLTGVRPEVHGITWNGDLTALRGKVRVPTIFGLARQAGFTTAAFFSKSKFHHLEVPGTLDHVESPFGWWGHWNAETTVRQVEGDLEDERPNLTFVHFGEPDYAGHEHGWMGPEYAEAVRKADWAVSRVLGAADEVFGAGNYTVIVTADHGGDGHEHGLDTPEHRTIPWIAWGKGVSAGTALPEGIRTVDTAATALWLLGVPVPENWLGRQMAGAFGPVPKLRVAEMGSGQLPVAVSAAEEAGSASIP
jgi:arylsulfatase A-like enzyme